MVRAVSLGIVEKIAAKRITSAGKVNEMFGYRLSVRI